LLPFDTDLPFDIEPHYSQYIGGGFYLLESSGFVLIDQNEHTFVISNDSNRIVRFYSYAFCDSLIWLNVEDHLGKKKILTVYENPKSFEHWTNDKLSFKIESFKINWNKNHQVFQTEGSSDVMKLKQFFIFGVVALILLIVPSFIALRRILLTLLRKIFTA
jgi:hypothetical protein